MTSPVYPCLWYNNQAKEAAELYCSVFKDSAIVTETPTVVSFQLNGKKIIGLNGGPMFEKNPSISLFVYCDSVAETDRIWNKLIEGGNEYMPIDTYPWSERYGWLKDKFGMTWQIASSGQNDGVMRILPSLLFVGEQFARASEAIQLYSGIFEQASTQMMVKYPEGDFNEGKVMYSEIRLNNSEIVLMDGPGDHNYQFNEGVSLVVECETQTEVDHYWNKLTEGGVESMCGWLKDKFGISWQIVPKILMELMADPEKASIAFERFKNMRKLIIDKLVID
jgi:predicted 3-demethylubiquinone-9 3-methyltransferase (glyoxalase superfamily)